MCGIYGFIGARFDGDERLLAAMDRALFHRGPDEGGAFFAESCGIGMRRLSIIDLAGGTQPMADATGRYRIVFNGEIYNYRELRDELIARGTSFRTHSDTETILLGYLAWGADVVRRLSGMFAFCIYDDVTGEAFFARDHFGKKPLYFWPHDGRLFFASEIKALLEHPGFERRLNLQAVSDYLTLKHVPSPSSIFDGVRSLPAGHVARYDGSALKTESYYAFHSRGHSILSEEEAAEELLERLRNAVRARMLAADVPVGSYLSGGLDSSLVAALAVEFAGSNIHTFSMGYREEMTHKGDVPFARMMAQRLGTKHHELLIGADDVLTNLPAIVRAFDEPFGGTTSPYFLTELIAQHVKVAVSGDGADELFGSYAAHRAAPVVAGIREGGTDYGTFAANAHLIDACAGEPDQAWRTRFLAFTDAEKRELMPASASLRTTTDYFAPYYEAATGDLVNRTLEAEVRTLLPDGVLTYVDRLSMAHSVEVRSPFLDRSIVEFAGSLPGRLKVRFDATKSVLRTAAAKLLPREILDRPKVGFILPIDAWLGSRFDALLERTLNPDALSHGLFDTTVVRRYVAELQGGNRSHTYKVWTLVMFQLWYELYVATPRPVRL
jgi:asparagine synthase (glutamine-hydrolysing)